MEFEEFEAYDARSDDRAESRAARAKRIINIAGAVCSVALVMGLTLWGYRLAVRDVSGVPVMQALGGAMRIAPTDPGGDQASNQGLSVNAIAAVGTSSPTADQVTLAPRAVELQPDDAAGLTMASESGAAALPDLQTAELTVTGLAAPGALDTEAPLMVTNVAATSGDIEGLAPARSLRPQARPAALTVPSAPQNVQTVSAPAPALAPALAPAPAPAPAKEIDPVSVTAGTRLAQLGAFDTPDLAREKFAELQGQFGELMAGKDMVIQSATSGGRTFYRLRAFGFEGDDDARRFCAALQAESADCIPVAQR